MNFIGAAREALAEALVDAGPGQPTLCEGWNTEDLAAHLFLREHRPALAAGMRVPALAGKLEEAMELLAKSSSAPESFTRLVGRIERGHSGLSPLRVGALDEKFNLLEYFVHTEDVLRAQPDWAPRELNPGYEEALWTQLAMMSKLLFRSSPVGVVLVSDHGPRKVAKRAEVSVAVSGPVGELVLFAFGRDQVAQVHFTGEPQAIARLTASERSV